MLCLTGNEKSNCELLARLRSPQSGKQPLLHEVRADLLNEPPDFSEMFGCGKQIIFTCRSRNEGGAFTGLEGERLALLEKSLEFNPWALDIELDTQTDLRDRLIAAARSRGVKVLLSKHIHGHCDDLRAEVSRLCAIDADYWKFVATVNDSSELCGWLDIEDDGRLLLIAAGAAGQLSRFWYARFGAPFTYIALDEAHATADFQPTLADVENGRVPDDRNCAAFLIMGGRQIIHSRGPHVFSRLFKNRAFNGVYNLAISDEPRGLLELADKLCVRGASVTKPLKEKIIPLLVNVDARAAEIAAVNTLRRDSDGWHGTNTDAGGFEGALYELYAGATPHGARALLLGAGGAARAVVYALLKNGFRVCVCNRTPARALKLAGEFGLETCLWEERSLADFDLLVNATSVGMDDPDSTPFPFIEKLKDRLIIDIISHPVESRLVREARAAGAKAATGGKPMWLFQAVQQLEFWLDWHISTGELEKLT